MNNTPKKKRGRPRKNPTVEVKDPPQLKPCPQSKRQTKRRKVEKDRDDLEDLMRQQEEKLKALHVVVLKVGSGLNDRVTECENFSKKNSENIDELRNFQCEVRLSLETIVQAAATTTKYQSFDNEDTKTFKKTQVGKDPIHYQNFSDIQNQRDEVKPTVLRKFRPPTSKYKLKLQAEEKAGTVIELMAETAAEQICSDLKSSENTNSANDEVTIKITSSSTQVEVGNVLYVEKLTETEEDTSHCAPNFDAIMSPFGLINSWLAKKDPHRCFKHTKSLSRMRTREGLIATYKCMAECCSFTTISQKNFTKHLQYHEVANSQEKFLYFCPYCIFNTTSSTALVEHYRVHRHDKFQCGFCFYRSASDQSCVEHVKTHHVETQSQLVYECPLETAPDVETSHSRIRRCRQEYLKPLKCTSCVLSFYLIDAYETHLSAHAMKEETKATASEDYIKLRTMMSNNAVGFYECVYCAYATNIRSELRSHMQDHPSELMFVCERKNMTANPHSIESAVICKLPRMKGLKAAVPFEDGQDIIVLRNTLNIPKISD